jgi:hypothetical protein
MASLRSADSSAGRSWSFCGFELKWKDPASRCRKRRHSRRGRSTLSLTVLEPPAQVRTGAVDVHTNSSWRDVEARSNLSRRQTFPSYQEQANPLRFGKSGKPTPQLIDEREHIQCLVGAKNTIAQVRLPDRSNQIAAVSLLANPIVYVMANNRVHPGRRRTSPSETRSRQRHVDADIVDQIARWLFSNQGARDPRDLRPKRRIESPDLVGSRRRWQGSRSYRHCNS